MGSFVSYLIDSLLDPVALVGIAAAALVLFSGLAARVVEALEVRRPPLRLDRTPVAGAAPEPAPLRPAAVGAASNTRIASGAAHPTDGPVGAPHQRRLAGRR